MLANRSKIGRRAMQKSQGSNANLARFPEHVQDYMNAVKHEIAQAHYIGRSAMNVQNFNAPAAPGTPLVSALSETIAPIANIIAAALISLSKRFANRRDDRPSGAAVVPAPHVAMVMVPGNYVTEPFLRR